MAKSVKSSSNSLDTNKKKPISKSSTADKAKDTKQNKIIEKKSAAKKTIETKAKGPNTKSLSKDTVEKKFTVVSVSNKSNLVATAPPQIKKKKFPASVVFGKPSVKKIEEKTKPTKSSPAPAKNIQVKVVVPSAKTTAAKPTVKTISTPTVETKKSTNAQKIVEVKFEPAKKVVTTATKKSVEKVATLKPVVVDPKITVAKSINTPKKSVEIKPTQIKENTTKTKVTTVAIAESAKNTPVSTKTKVSKTDAVGAHPNKSTKSVNKGNIRYSDEDLAIFRQVIDQQKSEITEEINSLNERIEAFNNRDFTEESTYSLHMAEQTSDALEAERARNRISDLTDLVKKLNDAIIRIENKTYGICRICNCLIAKERLLVVPVTTLSASYKLHGKCPEDGIDRTEKI